MSSPAGQPNRILGMCERVGAVEQDGWRAGEAPIPCLFLTGDGHVTDRGLDAGVLHGGRPSQRRRSHADSSEPVVARYACSWEVLAEPAEVATDEPVVMPPSSHHQREGCGTGPERRLSVPPCLRPRSPMPADARSGRTAGRGAPPGGSQFHHPLGNVADVATPALNVPLIVHVECGHDRVAAHTPSGAPRRARGSPPDSMRAHRQIR